MDVSPFAYQGPLPPKQVRGRDELLADLTERVTERRVTALLGPRRFGKTSVLGRLAYDLTEISTVAVDLFGVATHDDLVMRIADALLTAVPEVREPAFDVAVTVGVDLGVARTQLTLSPRKRPDARAVYAGLLRTIVEVSQRTPLLLVLDEFQSIVDVEGAAAALRSELQHHYRNIGLIFAGSAPSAMRNVFTRHDQPFFNQADLLEIQPLSASAVRDIVDDGFRSTGRDAGQVAPLVHQFTGGHPQRTMRVADAVWRRAEDAPGHEVWRDALDAVRAAEAPSLASAFADLGKSEQKVLRLVANDAPLFGADAASLGLSRGSAEHARDSLLDDGKLANREGQLVVVDPLLADWFRERLPL